MVLHWIASKLFIRWPPIGQSCLQGGLLLVKVVYKGASYWSKLFTRGPPIGQSCLQGGLLLVKIVYKVVLLVKVVYKVYVQ